MESKKQNGVSQDLNRAARINDIADQTYSFIKKKGITVEELGQILYRVRKAAASNAKI